MNTNKNAKALVFKMPRLIKAEGKVRVLLAEDNPLNRKVVKDLLAKMDCEVDVAGTGYEVIELVKLKTYDLVLMDITMPELDGIDATRKIRELQSKEQLPIIAVTAHAIRGDREKFLAAGMDGYVAKPIKREHLAEEMIRLLDVDYEFPTERV